ncbi:MAG: GTPase Era [Alphaproteobacteria bacterium]|nr:GTPase Era [Alphaproteobacteria bacterium]
MTDSSNSTSSNSKCGFITIIGAPNAGKSTLLNKIIGQKLSIVSPKPQTTRRKILGVYTKDENQIIFIDTPGIFLPNKRLDKAMVKTAFDEIIHADEIIMIYDASQKTIDPNTHLIITELQKSGKKINLILNKIDLIAKENLLQLSKTMQQFNIFNETFMISALTGDGIDKMLNMLIEKIPYGQWHFPDDQISDISLRELAEEITRECFFDKLYQELPYALTIETERWEDFNDGSVKINQCVLIQKNSQKVILLGHNGAKIKEVRMMAQKELETVLERKVHLFLHVKVKPDWNEDPNYYKKTGLDFNN